jgi:hypothetical protein
MKRPAKTDDRRNTPRTNSQVDSGDSGGVDVPQLQWTEGVTVLLKESPIWIELSSNTGPDL